ncbi:MAG: FecR domain-containing protein, partial [Pseudomonadales bacterium]
LLCTSRVALAQESSATDAKTQLARVVEVEGEAWYRPTGENAEEIAVSRDLEISAGGTVVTGKRGKVALLLADESLVRLHYNSEFTLRAAAPTAGWLQRASRQLKSSYELLRGELWFRNKRRETDIDIDTAHVSISVRGTEFSVEAGEEVVLVNMLEGAIQATNAFGQLDAASGEQVIAERGKAPRKRLLLNPDDAVQWTIKLPPLFDTRSFAALCLQWSKADEKEPLRQATAMAAEGDYLEAAAMLEEVAANSPDKRGAAIAVYRNWLLLESGEGAAAAKVNQSIVQDNPEFVPALYLDTLLALMQNDTRRALAASARALAVDANDANAQLLRSYALQAAFRLAAAKGAAERAIALDPGLIVARLQSARLALGAGDFDTAIAILNEAAAINDSNDLDVLTMRGFALLARGNAAGASNDFEAAQQTGLGSADLALGRGLLAMRSGDRERALAFIAEAVAIEPLDASYMNYFGRMLYEMRRFDRAIEVLQRASELDPNDPTPYYLLAIIQRDLNRDGEAIALLQEAEVRNDKRAVYRPRYVLDQDLAIKNVDQSLAFQAFRLNAWAKRKAVDALSRDRNNYSAHLLYAGAVNEEPGRDTIFASETLKARLLQPANANTFNTFANYTSVFDVPTFGGVASASTGSFDITELDLTLYGAVPKANLALQGAISRARSDGWRGTEDELFRSTALLAKWDAAPRHSFLATFNRIELEQSDNLLQRFEFDAPSEPRNERANQLMRYELGYHYKPSPAVNVLSYVTLLEQELDQFERRFSPPVIITGSGPLEIFRLEDTLIDETIVITQNQFSVSSDKGSYRAGVFTYNNDIDRDESYSGELTVGSGIPSPCTLCILGSEDFFTTSKRSQRSTYLGATHSLTPQLSLEGALYWDRYTNTDTISGEQWLSSQLNPRMGLVYKPYARHTFRLA